VAFEREHGVVDPRMEIAELRESHADGSIVSSAGPTSPTS
jgi:hypothetical protein